MYDVIERTFQCFFFCGGEGNLLLDKTKPLKLQNPKKRRKNLS